MGGGGPWGAWGHAPPEYFLKIDALRLLLRPFGTEPGRSSYTQKSGSRSIASNFWLSMRMHLYASWFWISTRKGTNVDRTARWGDITRRATGELYRAPEIAIYLRTYLRASLHHSTATYACIPPAGPPWTNSSHNSRFIWTAVILNSSKTSGPLSNGWEHKIYIKSSGGQKGVRANPLEPPCLRASLCGGEVHDICFLILSQHSSHYLGN